MNINDFISKYQALIDKQQAFLTALADAHQAILELRELHNNLASAFVVPVTPASPVFEPPATAVNTLTQSKELPQ